MWDILNMEFFGNKVWDYATAVLLFFALLIFIWIFRKILLNRLRDLAKKTDTTIDDFLIRILRKILIPLSYYGAFYLSIEGLTIDPAFRKIINVLGMALVMVFSARFITLLIAYLFDVYLVKKGKNVTLERSLDGMLKVVKVIIWGLAIVFFLDNIGFKISTVIAGLGIGGVAVALAAQAVLQDLFSYFSIVIDRPFELGDFIIIGEYMGTVEHIGVKTTRIRSLGGEQLVFSNTDLTNSRVRNYKRMDKRRVVFKFGVVYQTTAAQLREIPGVVKNIVEGISDTFFDRAHFFSYADSSLVFEAVYYVLGSDYNKYMDIQQEINLRLKEELETRGVEFAYPTQTVYLTKES